MNKSFKSTIEQTNELYDSVSLINHFNSYPDLYLLPNEDKVNISLRYQSEASPK